MDSTIGILQNSQRLRYESLSNFATDLNRATKHTDIAEALAAHVKYIVDAYILRLSHRHDAKEWSFEVSRGECKVFRPKHDTLWRFENDILDSGLPVSHDLAELSDRYPLEKTSFNNPKIAEIRSIPAFYFENQKVVVTTGIKKDVNYIELDFKFLRSIADLVANKMLQLELLKEIESNNKELKQKNTQITKLNRTLEQTVALRTAELTNANEELRTLFYRTSHDFRAPLANILGLANLGKLITTDEETQDLFTKCEQVVHRLDAMLAKLNVLSSYSYETHIKPVDFSGLLNDLKTNYGQRLQQINGKFIYDVDLHDDHIANPHIYNSIFDNLLENSINFHNGNLLIQVYVFKYKNDLVIKFSDNGQGISPRVIGKVYDMYYRGNTNSTGSGLGLYVVRKLVRSLSGDVFVQSKLKSHTHFIIKVPFSQQL